MAELSSNLFSLGVLLVAFGFAAHVGHAVMLANGRRSLSFAPAQRPAYAGAVSGSFVTRQTTAAQSGRGWPDRPARSRAPPSAHVHRLARPGRLARVVTPAGCNAGIMAASLFKPGKVGMVSRSGTLTYEIAMGLTRAGVGQSTCVGMGGDPVHGLGFLECLKLFEADPQTEAIVLVGEIGGDDEERAAEFAAANLSKPLVAYIAGFTAPPGKRMGHAGAIISGSSGTAAAKAAALEAAGIPVARRPDETPGLVVEALRGM